MAHEGDASGSQLATQRLLLRPCMPSDRARLLSIFRDPYVRRYLWDSLIVELADVDSIIAASSAAFLQYGLGIWCASERARPTVTIGFVGARPNDAGELELIYGFLPEHWGRGFALEAASEVLSLAFARGQPRVWAGTDLENKASQRVMQRLGMRFDRSEKVGGLPQVFYVIERAAQRG